MTFYEYYYSFTDNIKKRNFRKQVINACKIEPTTFYSWLARKIIPPLAQEKISEIIGLNQKDLFPEE